MSEPWLNLEQAGRYLGRVYEIPNDPDPEKTRKKQLNNVYMLAYRGTIPSHKLGRQMVFRQSELDRSLSPGGRKCQSTSQPVNENAIELLRQSLD